MEHDNHYAEDDAHKCILDLFSPTIKASDTHFRYCGDAIACPFRRPSVFMVVTRPAIVWAESCFP